MRGSHKSTLVAYNYLKSAHASVNALLDSLMVVRAENKKLGDKTHGRLSNDELELLRAAIVFTSSGLDASLHRLIRDALPLLAADTSKQSYVQFVKYRRDTVSGTPPGSFKTAVTSADPLSAMLALWVEDRARGSYQGTSDLKQRVRLPLGIPSARIDDARIDALDTFFKARNMVVHDMDYTNPVGGTARSHRSIEATLEECDLAFSIANDFIHETAYILR